VTQPTRNVREIMFDKSNGRTLGDMRNLSLDMVPEHAIWTTWDDDDYRHPTYLSKLHGCMKRANADAVFHTRRYEYNYLTGFSWGFRNDDGFWIVFTKKKGTVRYAESDVNEDIDIRQQVQRASANYFVWTNPPHIYIRTIHGANTSPTLNKNKTSLDSSQDFALTSAEHDYIKRALAVPA
jgi:hypothetical protein